MNSTVPALRKINGFVERSQPKAAAGLIEMADSRFQTDAAEGLTGGMEFR
jgi:hypothetical protein